MLVPFLSEAHTPAWIRVLATEWIPVDEMPPSDRHWNKRPVGVLISGTFPPPACRFSSALLQSDVVSERVVQSCLYGFRRTGARAIQSKSGLPY
jgi:hypothetical protein